MPIVVKEDLYSRIYEDNLNEITRDNDDLVTRAISGAISEAKMYLSRYDLAALFGTDTEQPELEDVYLKNLCLDIAVYRLVLLACPGIDYERAEKCYEMAVKGLKEIQKGNAQPEGWPYKETTGETAPNGNSVFYTSGTKRNNHW